LIKARVAETVGEGLGSASAQELVLGGLRPETLDQYYRRFDAFAEFCEAAGLCAYPASEQAVLRFLGFLEEDTRDELGVPIRSTTAKGYITAIATLHRLGKETAPAMERKSFVDKALKAWAERDKYRSKNRFTRCAVPAEGVEAALQAALREDATERAVKGAAMLGLGFLYYARAGTLHGLRRTDVVWDSNYLLVVKVVDKAAVGTLKEYRQVRLARVDNVDLVVRVLEKWLGLRGAGGELFFAKEGERPGTSDQLSCLYRDTLAQVDVRAQGIYYYGSHSVRAGGASCCHVLGVNKSDYHYLGGWSEASTVVEKHYIDRSICYTEAGNRFFGWLLPQNRTQGFAFEVPG